MSDKNKPQDDLSIEEILGSIRRIIAEDDEPEKQKFSEDEDENFHTGTLVAEHDEAALGEPEEDEEPLELTNKIEEDGTIIDMNASNEYVAPAPLGTEAPEPEQIDFVEQKPEEIVEEPIRIVLEESEPMALQDEDLTPSEALVSTSTAEATSAVMAKLARHTALLEEGQSSGVTVEGMVREILKPMLKSWLDENLPNIVQKMVEREIERLTKHL
jgi:cell pole-organizing protein PopZ